MENMKHTNNCADVLEIYQKVKQEQQKQTLVIVWMVNKNVVLPDDCFKCTVVKYDC